MKRNKRRPLPHGFFWNLSVLLNAGISIDHSIETLEKTEQNIRMKSMLNKIRRLLHAGVPFSECLRKTAAIPDFAAHLTAFGEQTGKLRENLALAAQHFHRLHTLRQKTVSALLYPAFVILASMIGVSVLIKFFLPNFIPIFQDLHGKLPFQTRLLILLYACISFRFFLIGGSFAAAIFFVSKRRAGRVTLALPIFGKMIKRLFAAEFCSTVAAAHKAGIPLERALGFFSQSISHERFRSMINDLRLSLVRGESLSDFLTGHPLMPSYVGPMAAVAENTGKIGDLFSRCSTLIEEEIQDRLQRFTAALEPAILGFLGIFIGFILTGIFSPLYKMLEVLT